MRIDGSMSANMWIRQHPSAPKAVAMVRREPKRSTAQRSIASGELPSSKRLADSSSWEDINDSDMLVSRTPAAGFRTELRPMGDGFKRRETDQAIMAYKSLSP